MTTLLENAFEKEETLMNKYQVTVIIGSSILFVFVIIAICVYLMVKFNVCKSNTRDEETITKPQFNETCDLGAYENTPNGPVENTASRHSYTSLKLNESFDSDPYENTPNGPVNNTTSINS